MAHYSFLGSDFWKESREKAARFFDHLDYLPLSPTPIPPQLTHAKDA